MAELGASGRRTALALVQTLAEIHAVDIDRIGLGGLASRKPYARRQLARWTAQWEWSRTEDLPALDELGRRLSAAAPRQHETTVVHGDFNLRNVISHPDTGEIRAVLGLWKLAIIYQGIRPRALDEPQNRAAAGTPTSEQVVALVLRAHRHADEAGI